MVNNYTYTIQTQKKWHPWQSTCQGPSGYPFCCPSIPHCCASCTTTSTTQPYTWPLPPSEMVSSMVSTHVTSLMHCARSQPSLDCTLASTLSNFLLPLCRRHHSLALHQCGSQCYPITWPVEIRYHILVPIHASMPPGQLLCPVHG